MNQADEIIAAYAEGRTVLEVARQFRTHTSKVSALLKERGVEIRKPQRRGPERTSLQMHPWPQVPRYEDAVTSEHDASWLGQCLS